METARTFTDRLVALLARERTALGEFLVGLAVFDERRLWAELGYSSLFDFLHRELGLSKGAAFYRKTAVELIGRFPEVAASLTDGKLCLMTVAEVARVLTPENRAEVLPRFFHLSKREAQALAAALLPLEVPARPEVVTTVRRAPAVAPALALVPEIETGRGAAPAAVQPVELGQSRTPVQPVELAEARPAVSPDQSDGTRATERVAPPPPPPATTEPLTADLNRLHLTVSREFLSKLEAARAALSHSHPGASAQEILEAGLDLLLARHAKRKGLTDKPRREPPPSANPAHVPAHVRRAVWERDGGRCTWPLAGGGVCGSTHRLELDHVVPLGKGGPSTLENVRVLCDVHNQEAARRVYGDAWMDRYTRRGMTSAPPVAPAAAR